MRRPQSLKSCCCSGYWSEKDNTQHNSCFLTALSDSQHCQKPNWAWSFSLKSFTQLLVPLLLWKCVQCFYSTWSCAFSLIISSHAKSLHTVFSEPLFPLRSWKMPEDKISWKFLLKMEQPFITVFVIFHGDLHFLKLWQALEGSCGLQHGEVIVVETPATIIERDHREEDGGKQHHKGKSDFGMCACFVLSAHPCSRNPHTHVNTDIQDIVWHSVCFYVQYRVWACIWICVGVTIWG